MRSGVWHWLNELGPGISRRQFAAVVTALPETQVRAIVPTCPFCGVQPGVISAKPQNLGIQRTQRQLH